MTMDRPWMSGGFGGFSQIALAKGSRLWVGVWGLSRACRRVLRWAFACRFCKPSLWRRIPCLWVVSAKCVSALKGRCVNKRHAAKHFVDVQDLLGRWICNIVDLMWCDLRHRQRHLESCFSTCGLTWCFVFRHAMNSWQLGPAIQKMVVLVWGLTQQNILVHQYV